MDPSILSASQPTDRTVVACSSFMAMSSPDPTRLRANRAERRSDGNAVLYTGDDPPLLMTQMPSRHVPDGSVNVHGHTHPEALTRTRHVNVRVEQVRYRPV